MAIRKTVFFLFLAFFAKLALAAEPYRLMSWGWSSAAKSAIGINEVRFGCSGLPTSCLRTLESSPLTGASYVALAIANRKNEKQLPAYSKEYGELAKNVPFLKEVGIDDFWSFLLRLSVEDPALYLDGLIENIRNGPAKLKFGVTVYEDQLDAISRDTRRLPPTLRAKIDRVALYLHYRNSYENYSELVMKARSLFPNAKIYGGVYHYDRKSYFPCKKGRPLQCKDEEELLMFNEALKEQVSLLKLGKLDGLEFYPGNFEIEDKWIGWQNPRLCPVDRKQQCVEVSREMGKSLVETLRTR